MLKIRRATHDDAQMAYDIRRLAILDQCTEHYGATAAQAWANVPYTDGYAELVADRFHLACLDDTVVATGMLDFESGELGALFVHPGYLQRGIARAMVAHPEHLAVTAGLEEIHLDATLNAAAFYRRCGYAGDRLAVYHSPFGLELPCVPMRKALAPV